MANAIRLSLYKGGTEKRVHVHSTVARLRASSVEGAVEYVGTMPLPDEGEAPLRATRIPRGFQTSMEICRFGLTKYMRIRKYQRNEFRSTGMGTGMGIEASTAI